jgi:hypothetical protein
MRKWLVMDQSVSAPEDTPKPLRRRRCKLERCRELFQPTKKWQLFCCDKHRLEWHTNLPDSRKMSKQLRAMALQVFTENLPWMAKKIARMLEIEPPPVLIERIADRVIAKNGTTRN